MALLKKILLLLASLVLCLCIAEILLNWKAAETLKRHLPLHAIRATTGERIGVAGAQSFMLHPFTVYINYPNEKTKYFTINSHGTRGSEFLFEKGSKKRILIVGASVAFGSGLNNDGQSFSAQLEKRLPDAEVINAGVVGHLSGQELSYFITELVDFQPDLVITFDGYNDVADQLYTFPNRSPHTYGVNASFFLIQERLQLLSRLENYNIYDRIWCSVSIIFKGLFNLFDEAFRLSDKKPNSRLQTQRLFKENPALYNQHLQRIADRYTSNITKIARIAHKYGAEFINIEQPHKSFFAENSKDEYLEPGDYKNFISKTRPVFAEKGVKQLLINDKPGLLADRNFTDAVHLNAQAYEILADTTVQYLKQEGLWK